MGQRLRLDGEAPTFAILGPLEVMRLGDPVHFRGLRRRALLARLCVSANEVVAVDTLIFDLWADHPPENPVNALQAYVSHLRSALGSGSGGEVQQAILTRKPGYVLSVGADRHDALCFERLAAEGHAALGEDRPEDAARICRQALALWRGPALAEFADEAWARPVAARLEDMRWAVLEDRFEADMALGRHSGLIGEIEAASARQPLRERFSAQLILALYRTGRQADALRAYQQVRRMLGEDLGIEPGPALRELEQAILQQKPQLDWTPPERPAPTAPPATRPAGSVTRRNLPPPLAGARRVSSPSFVSRSAELACLRAGLDRACAGEPALVVVGGEAGVGKTRLVSELTASIGEADDILVGRCIDGGRLPYGPIIQALRSRMAEDDAVDELLGPGRAELARLLPDLAPTAAADEPDQGAGSARLRMLDSLLGLLQRLARSRPLVLVLEDIHWADPSTLELLVFLVRSLRSERILLVATYRSDDATASAPLRPFLAEISRSPLVERLELRRFTRDEVLAQLTGILGRPPDPAVVEAIWSRSGGNAFFAEELLTMEPQEPGGATPSGGPGSRPALPTTLRDILLARIEAMSGPARSVVTAAAVGGPRVAHPLLAAVAPLAEPDLLAALREAAMHHVLVVEPTEDVYAFRHALLQEAAYGELLPGERHRLHAAYARALTERPELCAAPGAAADVANHWFAAGEPAEALPAAVAAGRADEARYGFTEARHHFERALEVWASVPDASSRAGLGHVELLQRAAQAAFLSGDHAGAASFISRALDLVRPADEPLQAGLLQERLGRYLWAAGESEAALSAYERAAVLVPADPPSGARARILAAQGQALMLMARYRESSSRCQEAIAVARLSGARSVEGHARNTLGCVLACLGRVDAGTAELRRALTIAEEADDLDDHARALQNLADLLAGPAHRLDEALAAATEGIRVTARLGLDRDYGVSLRVIAATVLHSLGRWSEAERLLREAGDLDPLGMANIDLQLGLARVLVSRGHFDEARDRLEATRRLCSGAVDPQVHAPCAAMEAELALWEGRPDEARRAVAQGLEHLEHTDDTFFTPPLLSLGLRAEADLAERARAGEAGDDLEEALSAGRRLIEQARSLLTAAPPPTAEGDVQTCEAELRRLHGQSDPHRWARAAQAWEQLGMPYPAALAHWRHAETLLGVDGATVEALHALSRAGTIAHRIGADPLRNATADLARRHEVDLTSLVGKAADEPPPGGSAGVGPGAPATPLAAPSEPSPAAS